MPFPAGTVVLCEQGNLTGEGMTHSLPNNFYALDFSNRAETRLEVAAAARGRVMYVLSDSPLWDYDAGNGYGNQVKIEHADDFYTLYSHLDEVAVKPGDQVEAGSVLGTMGLTGAAGGRHLHLGLHKNLKLSPGARGSEPIRSLQTVVFEPKLRQATLGGEEFQMGTQSPWHGSVYGSETAIGRDPGAPLEGGLRERLLDNATRLNASLARRRELAELGRRLLEARAPLEPAPIQRLLTNTCRSEPENPVPPLYLAQAVLIPQRKHTAALKQLELAERHCRDPRYYERWIPAKIQVQLGVVAYQQSRAVDARRHFKRALTLDRSNRTLAQVLKYERLLRGAPDAGAPDAGAPDAY